MAVAYATKALQKALANQQVAEKQTGLPMKLPIMRLLLLTIGRERTAFLGPEHFHHKTALAGGGRLVRNVHSGGQVQAICEGMR